MVIYRLIPTVENQVENEIATTILGLRVRASACRKCQQLRRWVVLKSRSSLAADLSEPPHASLEPAVVLLLPHSPAI